MFIDEESCNDNTMQVSGTSLEISSKMHGLVTPIVDDGSSFIAVPLKSSFLKPLRFPRFSGKLSQFEHPETSRHSSNFKLQMVLGRHKILTIFES